EGVQGGQRQRTAGDGDGVVRVVEETRRRGHAQRQPVIRVIETRGEREGGGERQARAEQGQPANGAGIARGQRRGDRGEQQGQKYRCREHASTHSTRITFSDVLL